MLETTPIVYLHIYIYIYLHIYRCGLTRTRTGPYFRPTSEKQCKACSHAPQRSQALMTSIALGFHHYLVVYMGVSKNRGTPKMDGENNGNPY